MKQPLFIHLGVRTGDNAKATAQLFSRDGNPAGYAKIAWNELTATFVRTEERRLRRLDGRAGNLGTPCILHSGEIYGTPFVVTAPLPVDARRLNAAQHAEMIQMSAISPIDRISRVGTSRRLRSLTDRMLRRQSDPLFERTGGPLVDLACRLLHTDVRVPILGFDHGDLVPWNACKDSSGKIWLWDWELSEDDTIAGTDILHWFVHSIHGTSPADLPTAVAEAADRALTVHQALGMGRTASLLAAASYVLISGERACALAESHRGWQRNRIGEKDVEELAALGHRFMDRAQ